MQQLIRQQLDSLASINSAMPYCDLTLSNTEIADLAEYLSLIKHWTIKVDLVSLQSDEMLVSRHIIDCVCANQIIASKNILPELVFVDVGSGAGLPGIILALLNRQRKIFLVEPRKKRCVFLNEVKRKLKLDRVEVCAMDFQKFVDCGYAGRCNFLDGHDSCEHDASSNFTVGLVISRALGMQDEYLQTAKQIISTDGFVAQMLGSEIANSQICFQNLEDFNFLLPPDNAKRTVRLFRI